MMASVSGMGTSSAAECDVVHTLTTRCARWYYHYHYHYYYYLFIYLLILLILLLFYV